MGLVGCFVTPHPPIIVPEVGGDSLAEAESTVRAMNTVRERTAQIAPDTIVLLSPHSPLATSRMGVSLAASYRGSLAYFRAPQVQLEAPGDQALAQMIMERSAAKGVPAAASAAGGSEFDLDHGAMVPLVFVTGGLKNRYKLVVLSFSYLGLEDHVRFGLSLIHIDAADE